MESAARLVLPVLTLIPSDIFVPAASPQAVVQFGCYVRRSNRSDLDSGELTCGVPLTLKGNASDLLFRLTRGLLPEAFPIKVSDYSESENAPDPSRERSMPKIIRSVWIHRYCNRGILSGIIASAVVAISRVGSSDGSRPCRGKRQLAASFAGGGIDRSRAALTGCSRQCDVSRWFIGAHLKVQCRGGDPTLV
jgi:hypothetical protein